MTRYAAFLPLKLFILRVFTRCECGSAWGEEMDVSLGDGALHYFLCTECGSTSNPVRVPLFFGRKTNHAALVSVTGGEE